MQFALHYSTMIIVDQLIVRMRKTIFHVRSHSIPDTFGTQPFAVR